MPNVTYHSKVDRFSVDINKPEMGYDNGRRICLNEHNLTVEFEPIGPVGAGSRFTTDDENIIAALDAKCNPPAVEARFMSRCAAPAAKTRSVKGFESE